MVKKAGLEGTRPYEADMKTPMYPVLDGGPQNLVDEMEVVRENARAVRARFHKAAQDLKALRAYIASAGKR